MLRNILTALAISATAAPVAAASVFGVDFAPLNGEPIDASARLTYDGSSMLRVQIQGSGFADGAHPAHIHGFTDADGYMPARAPVAPLFDPDVDGDGDGFTELLEGAPFYGGILLTLEGFASDAAGNVDYDRTFDISGTGIVSDLYGIADREIVLHGLFTDFEREDNIADGLGGGVNASNFVGRNYNAVLPAAVGEIAPVPVPAAGLLLLGGIGALAGLRRRAMQAEG